VSAGSVFQEAVRHTLCIAVPEAARRDLLAVLESNRSGPLQFLFDACVEAGLPRIAAAERAGAVYLCYCAGQLADDLADGDCDYLELPARVGPGAQFLLQNLFTTRLVALGIPPGVLADAARDLAVGAGEHSVEVRTTEWTAELAMQVAAGIAGCQISAYLRLLWCGTALEKEAGDLGWHVGVAAQVATDVASGDVRFHGLAPADRGALLARARASADRARARGLACVDAFLRFADPILREAR
jgi:hypothetical protein